MVIGVPKERKTGERRVAVVPAGVAALVALGHRVILEQEAGVLSGFTDEEFRTAGAEIESSNAALWKAADLVVKVKEPQPEEFAFFRPGLGLFCFLHLAVAPALTRALLEKQVIGLDYDLLALEDGRLPILEPMSVIAGKLSVQCGAYALQAGIGGRGVLLGGATGVNPAKVLVIGAGSAGSNAAWVADGMGADVCILDLKAERLKAFDNSGIRALVSSKEILASEITEADLVVGAVLIPGALAPKLITRDLLLRMKKRSVIVDISIDQGGIAETSHATTIAEPTFIESDVVHYCVPNMPALVPRTSTEALTSAVLPWTKLIASQGLSNALKTSAPVFRSLTTIQGKLTNKAIGQALSIPVLSEEETSELL